ncbi:MAG TPA: hypothetical protein VMV91_10105 [Rhodocyclaceae bacterium]|nr:hypothetical protein [Rhodocyclaceae bacterium]
MAFWKGLGKVVEGIGELIISPVEALVEYVKGRRKRMSGKYTVKIPASDSYPALVAHITYHGEWNTHDIDLITYEGRNEDVWDKLDDGDKMIVNSEINRFKYMLVG